MATSILILFFFNDTATTEIYTLSLHDALPIYTLLSSTRLEAQRFDGIDGGRAIRRIERGERSEEHTSELQSRLHLVCRLLLEKKKKLRRRQKRQPGISQRPSRSRRLIRMRTSI